MEFGFSLCLFGVRWWPHNLSLDDEVTSQAMEILYMQIFLEHIKIIYFYFLAMWHVVTTLPVRKEGRLVIWTVNCVPSGLLYSQTKKGTKNYNERKVWTLTDWLTDWPVGCWLRPPRLFGEPARLAGVDVLGWPAWQIRLLQTQLLTPEPGRDVGQDLVVVAGQLVARDPLVYPCLLAGGRCKWSKTNIKG